MSFIVYCAIVAGIFFTEYNIKKHVETSYDKGVKREYLKGRVRIEKHHNSGFAGSVAHKRSGVVAAASLAVTIIGIILFLASMGRHGNGFVRLGLSLVLGGAFSNTYERLKKRYVVDYLSFNTKVKFFSRLVFNVSDFCIILGALLTVLGILR
ncbi:MAG: signal peptidase II [Lachnospiraceae bacterium]|nr:signal peptidase II [Lachnospiraceae bacterium]